MKVFKHCRNTFTLIIVYYFTQLISAHKTESFRNLSLGTLPHTTSYILINHKFSYKLYPVSVQNYPIQVKQLALGQFEFSEAQSVFISWNDPERWHGAIEARPRSSRWVWFIKEMLRLMDHGLNQARDYILNMMEEP